MDSRVGGILVACLGLVLVVAAGGVVGTAVHSAADSTVGQDGSYIDIDESGDGEGPTERRTATRSSGDLEVQEVSPDGPGPLDEPGVYVIDVSSIDSITLEAAGPGGGGAGYDPDDAGAAMDGGDGGYVEGEFDVSSFEDIQVTVGFGGGGGDIIYGSGVAGSGLFDGGAGGWQTNQTAGGGGGGVTAVVGVTSSGDTTPLAAAGGGGGGSAWDSGNPITPSSESGGGGGAAGGVGGSTGAVGGSDGVDAEDSNGTVGNDIGGDGADAGDESANDGDPGGAWANPDYVVSANTTVGGGASGGEGAASFGGELGAPGENGFADWQDAGGPNLELQSIDYPENVSAGEDLTVSYTVTNTGSETGTESAVELVTDGAVADTDTDVTVAPGETTSGTLVIENVETPSAVELLEGPGTGAAVTDGGTVDGAPEIDPALEGATGETRALVYLQPADVAPEMDHEAVVERLKAHANRTQPAVKTDLEAMEGVRVEGSFWIVNALSVTYDASVVDAESLAVADSVVAVHENHEIVEPQPIVGEGGEPTNSDYTYGLEQIGAPTVWDNTGAQGEGAVVVIQDNGFDVDHEALTFEEAHAIDGDGNIVGDPQVGDHGTHVAGTATGTEGPDGTSFGVAPNAELHGHDIFSEGAVVGASIGSMQMAANMGADVVSGSWGSGCNNVFPDPVYNGDMIDPISNTRAAGTAVVASSGNAGDCVGGFGNDFESFTVGATDSDEDVTDFSSGSLVDKDSGQPNYGGNVWDDPPGEWPQSWVEPRVSAPGNNTYSSLPGDEYTDGFSGTSMAAPHVAGAIGLIQSATDTEFTGPEIREALTETAGKPSDWNPGGDDVWTNSDSTHDQPGIDSRYGYGIIDVPAAIDYLENSGNVIAFTVQLSEFGDSLSGTTTVEGGDDGQPDLQIQSIDAPATVAPTDDLTVEYTVGNVGDAEGTESAVELLVEGTGSSVDDSDTDVTVAPGGTESGALTFDSVGSEFDDGDTISLSVELADFGDTASDTTEVSDGPSGPAIELQSIDSPDSIQPNEDLNVDYTLENIGDEAGTESYVDLRVDGTSEDFDDTDTNVTVPAGGTVTNTLTFAAVATEFDPGDEITFTVDTWDSEDTASGSTTVEAPDEPLLQLQSVDAPDTVGSDENLTVSYTIENLGDAEGTESAVNLLLNGSVSATDEDVTVPAQGTTSGTLVFEELGQLSSLQDPTVASGSAGPTVDIERGSGVTQAVVTFRETASARGPAALQAQASASQQPLVDLAAGSEALSVEQQFWITNAALVTVDTDGTVLRELAALEGVESVVPNAEFEALSGAPAPSVRASDTAPADHGDHTYGLEQINAPQVWEQYGTQGEGASIAVLDTGVDADHPDIDLARWAEFDENGSAVDSDPQDYGAHGTHVSGTATGGSAGGTHIGVAPAADLYHAGVLTDCAGPCSGTFAQIIAGIEWAVAEDADIISMSLGAPGYFDQMVDPVRNAVEAGTIVVSSAGNSGPGTSGSPGNVYDAISVGASNEAGDIWGSSSGEQVTADSVWSSPPTDWPGEYVVPSVSAPGVDVYSSVPGGGYDGTYDGTSMAAPHVSGVVALAESASDEDLSPAIVEQGLEATAFKPGDSPAPPGERDTRYGSGIVDALAAVEYLEDPPEGDVVTYEVELADAGDSLGGEILVEQSQSVPPVPGGDGPPGDVDGDDRYEDINGDDAFDIFDIQVLFENYDHEMMGEYGWAFDFDGDGSLDIFDVQALFEKL